jgi:hypothetical protein
MLYPQGNPYKRPNIRTEYQLFTEDYFSGADANIYFGDIWVEEINGLNFRLEEKVMPLFGYNSHTFDVVARGARLVEGSFSINFKQAGYLQMILDNSAAIKIELDNLIKNKAISENEFEKYKLEEILKASNKDFEQLSEKYENAIWGIEDDEEKILSKKNEPFFKNNAHSFDIKISYGPNKEDRDINLYNQKVASKSPITNWGKDNSIKRFGSSPNKTVETINGVHIFGYEKIGISTLSDGQVILESYNFFAKDINSGSKVLK